MNKTWLLAVSAALTLAAGSGSAYAAGASVTSADPFNTVTMVKRLRRVHPH